MEDDYDLADSHGVAEKNSQIIDGSKVAEGDVLLGLASLVFTSNGYHSTAVSFNHTGEVVPARIEARNFKEVLLRLVSMSRLSCHLSGLVNGIAHIVI